MRVHMFVSFSARNFGLGHLVGSIGRHETIVSIIFFMRWGYLTSNFLNSVLAQSCNIFSLKVFCGVYDENLTGGPLCMSLSSSSQCLLFPRFPPSVSLILYFFSRLLPATSLYS